MWRLRPAGKVRLLSRLILKARRIKMKWDSSGKASYITLFNNFTQLSPYYSVLQLINTAQFEPFIYTTNSRAKCSKQQIAVRIPLPVHSHKEHHHSCTRIYLFFYLAYQDTRNNSDVTSRDSNTNDDCLEQTTFQVCLLVPDDVADTQPRHSVRRE